MIYSINFYCATHIHSTDYAVARCTSVCPSVCLSDRQTDGRTNRRTSCDGIVHAMLVCLSVCHTPVLSLNGYTYPQNFFHRRVAPPFQFSRTKWDGNIPTGTPLTGASNARVYEKITIFDQYHDLSRKWGHSYYGRRIGNRTHAFKWYQFEWPSVTFLRSWLFNVK